jgi:hypothetical protein
MTKKSVFAIIILYALFGILFISSTKIVLSIPQKNVFHLQKSNINNFDKLSDDIHFNVDAYNQNQDILYTAEFTGWAFMPFLQDDSKKDIKLIFVSGEHRYEVETELQERFDLRQVLLDNGISGYKHGFITKFSTLQMKNGTYKLYLFCYENDNTFGMVDTGRVYVKSYRTFSEYDGNP